MALNKSVLGELIKTNLKTVFTNGVDDKQMAQVCNAIADAIVSHITSSGSVTVTSVTGTVTTPTGPGAFTFITGEGVIK